MTACRRGRARPVRYANWGFVLSCVFRLGRVCLHTGFGIIGCPPSSLAELSSVFGG